MTIDPDAFEEEARRLARKFDGALNRSLLRLSDASTMPYGKTREDALTSAQAAVDEARTALDARRAHSLTLRPLTEDEKRRFREASAMLDALCARIAELNPRWTA